MWILPGYMFQDDQRFSLFRRQNFEAERFMCMHAKRRFQVECRDCIAIIEEAAPALEGCVVGTPSITRWARFVRSLRSKGGWSVVCVRLTWLEPKNIWY